MGCFGVSELKEEQLALFPTIRPIEDLTNRNAPG